MQEDRGSPTKIGVLEGEDRMNILDWSWFIDVASDRKLSSPNAIPRRIDGEVCRIPIFVIGYLNFLYFKGNRHEPRLSGRQYF